MNKKISALFLLGILVLFISYSAISIAQDEIPEFDIPMAAVINLENNTILITGALESLNTVQVTIPELPEGIWTIIKSETNLSGEPWAAWEMIFGENTRIVEDFNHTSRQYQNTMVVPERNALIFYDGLVVPQEPVLKIVQVEQIVTGEFVSSHNRVSDSNINEFDIEQLMTSSIVEILDRDEMETETFELEIRYTD